MNRAYVAALSLALAVTVPSSAHAFPHFGVHRTPVVQDGRVSLNLTNNGHSFKDVKIDGTIYTVLPHQSIAVKAPAGTPVYTETTGSLHHKGDVLFAVTPELQGTTVSLN